MVHHISVARISLCYTNFSKSPCYIFALSNECPGKLKNSFHDFKTTVACKNRWLVCSGLIQHRFWHLTSLPLFWRFSCVKYASFATNHATFGGAFLLHCSSMAWYWAFILQQSKKLMVRTNSERTWTMHLWKFMSSLLDKVWKCSNYLIKYVSLFITVLLKLKFHSF